MLPHLESLGQIGLLCPSSVVHQVMSMTAISHCMFVFSVCTNAFCFLDGGEHIPGWLTWIRVYLTYEIKPIIHWFNFNSVTTQFAS